MSIGGICYFKSYIRNSKGHKLKTIKGLATRPTSDKVKGAVFNILAAFVPGTNVLDIYAGTGL